MYSNILILSLLLSGSDGDASKAGSRTEGLMQTQYGGRIGYICDNEWDYIDAEVACRELDLYSIGYYDTDPEGE